MTTISNNEKPIPLAYMITCRTYGTWLHGDERGSVDRKHNQFLTPRMKHNPNWQRCMKENCKEQPFVMSKAQSKTVLQSVINTCQYADWVLYAAHVRSNHMHIIVKAHNKPPEQAAVSFKAYATRYLKHKYPDLQRKRYWSSGASTGYAFHSMALLRAIQYTVEEQHGVMACYCCQSYYDIVNG